jgi:hypothetical protein
MSTRTDLFNTACDYWLTGDWRTIKPERIQELGPVYYHEIWSALQRLNHVEQETIEGNITSLGVTAVVEKIEQSRAWRTKSYRRLRLACFDAYAAKVLGLPLDELEVMLDD